MPFPTPLGSLSLLGQDLVRSKIPTRRKVSFSLSKYFRGLLGMKNPCFFVGFPCLLQKKQGKEGQGRYGGFDKEEGLTERAR